MLRGFWAVNCVKQSDQKSPNFRDVGTLNFCTVGAACQPETCADLTVEWHLPCRYPTSHTSVGGDRQLATKSASALCSLCAQLLQLTCSQTARSLQGASVFTTRGSRCWFWRTAGGNSPRSLEAWAGLEQIAGAIYIPC